MIGGILRAATASKLRLVAALALAVAVVLGGAVGLGVLGAPAVTGVENRLAGVSEETTTLRTDMVVSNPNPAGVSADDLTVAYAVELNGVRMAGGRKEGVSVGTGDSTVSFETAVQNEQIPAWWVSHLERNQRTELRVDFELVVDFSEATGVGPTVTLPLDTMTRTVETDVFANEEQYPTGEPANGSRDGDTREDDGGTGEGGGADGGDGTAPPGGTPTATPTVDGGIIETPTDDEGVLPRVRAARVRGGAGTHRHVDRLKPEPVPRPSA